METRGRKESTIEAHSEMCILSVSAAKLLLYGLQKNLPIGAFFWNC